MANTDAEEKDATEYYDNNDDFNFLTNHCNEMILKFLNGNSSYLRLPQKHCEW